MKPAFALTLCEDGIGLLHRRRGGWQKLGEVSLDDPGLGQTLRLLRSTAEGLAEGPLLTKLVIPDSQILYTRLPVAGETEADKRASLRRGLDGLTPYPVDELVFDWQEAGDGTARLAVVARETLDEAESFADQHAFNPVCCVAAPPADRFEGEAFFGPTALAGGLLGRGERPERDSRPVRPGAMADYAAAEDGPRRASSAPKPTAPKPPATRSARAEPPVRKPAAPPAVTPVPRTGATAPTVPDLPDDPSPAFTSRRRGEGDAAQAEAPPQTEPVVPAAPSRLTLAPPTDETRAPPAPAPKADAPAARLGPVPPGRPPAAPRPATGSGRPTVGVALRRATTGIRAPAPLADAPRKEPRLRLGLALTGALVLAMGAISLWSMLPDGDEIATTPPAAERPEPSAPGDDVAALPDEPVAGPPALQRPAMTPLAADAPAPDTPPDTPAPPDPAAPPVLSETEAAEAYASTGLWQLAPEPLTAPPQDRIETLYIAELDPSIRPPRLVALPDPDAAGATDQPLPLQADPPGADETFVLDARGLVVATPDGALTPEGVMVYAGPPPLLPRGRASEPVPDPEAEAAPGAVTAAPAGAATALPEADIAPAAALPDSAAPDTPASALSGGVAVTEGRPALVPPPRPTLVVPVTPGRPRVTPPARPDPATTTPYAAPDAEPATSPEAEAAPPPAPPADDTDAQAAPDPAPPEIVAAAAAEAAPDPEPVPEAAAVPDLPGTAAIVADAAMATRLAPFRPRLRPAGITPAALAPEPPAAIPTLRPRTRPERPAATAPEAAPDPALNAGIEAALADALATEEIEEATSPAEALPEGAVRRSLRPAARPSDLGDRVAAAPPDDAPAAAPAVPPAAAAPAPRVPTSANVAREATVENAINLKKINLIGVYGTSGDRRALVRLPNGRYEKVKVGDRIDGGQVAAIGESELRYVKNGRSVVLDLPGG